MTKALEDIAAERARQISAEGWSAEHDDEHGNGELAAAAACYAFQASVNNGNQKNLGEARAGFISLVAAMWPNGWAWHWWKPKSKRRNLVRAGALILAEIERMDRAEAAAIERQKSCTCGTPIGDVEMHEDFCPLSP